MNLSIPIDQFIGPDAGKTISLTNSSADRTTVRERLTKHGDVDVPQHTVSPKNAPEAKQSGGGHQYGQQKA